MRVILLIAALSTTAFAGYESFRYHPYSNYQYYQNHPYFYKGFDYNRHYPYQYHWSQHRYYGPYYTPRYEGEQNTERAPSSSYHYSRNSE